MVQSIERICSRVHMCSILECSLSLEHIVSAICRYSEPSRMQSIVHGVHMCSILKEHSRWFRV